MPRDARFWRNVTIIAVAHIAIIIGLLRWNRETRKASLQNIVWMSGEAAAISPPSRTEAAPPPQTSSPAPDESAEPSIETFARSDLPLPTVPPSPTPPAPKRIVTPTPLPKDAVKPTAKPTPKATPKKTAAAKATAKPSPKTQKDDSEKKSATPKTKPSALSNPSSETSASPGKGSGNETKQPSEFAWYGTMLHDRFHKAWEQPKSIVATGARMSTIVKIRIEKDGRISKFTIVKPSGNIVVDESVAAIAQRVTQVDPIPDGLAKGAYYEVKIDFKLNEDN